MDKFTAAKLRTDFIVPLSKLILRLTDLSDELENQYRAGKLKHDWLPLNEGGATKGATAAVTTLEDFLKDEVEKKLAKAKKGTLDYREKVLKFKSDRKDSGDK